MASIVNQTLETLLVKKGAVGSMSTVGSFSFEDLVFERYYNTDWTSSELNADFTDYSNFVFYGSAEGRLTAFRDKLIKIENLQKSLENIFPSQSIASGSYNATSLLYGPVATINTGVYVIDVPNSYYYTGSTATPYYIQEKTKDVSLQIETILRGFDPYEGYLFFDATQTPYSASFKYVDGGTEYHLPSSWPKNIANQAYSPLTDSGSLWFDEQIEIAKRFDQFNQNNLIYTVPLHILEDDRSIDFLTFVAMIGNFFDNIKPYIDQFTEIYDRSPNPNEGLSKELINEVAGSFGIELPNLMAIRNIQEYVLGTTDAVSVRDATAETWKRLLHNLTFIQKSKGTKTSIETLFRSLGFHPALISVKESGIADVSSYQLVDEFTNSLKFLPASGSRIDIPQNLSGMIPQTIQFRFATNTDFSLVPTSSLFTADNKWKCELVAHPSISSLQRIEIKPPSFVPLITSSYFTFNDSDYYDVMVRKNPSHVDLTVIKNESGEVIYSSSMQESSNVILSAWNSTNKISLGGSGLLSYRSFEGLIDEVRLWGDSIGDAEFIAQTNDPGSFVGNSYSSSIDNLYLQLSFINEQDLSLGYINNESPYQFRATTFPTASVAGFISSSQYIRADRIVRYNLPTLGASSYVSNQIKVPDYNISQSMDASGIPTLYANKSHTIRYATTTGQVLRTVTVGVSPTDFINERISRALGSINLTDAIGDPAGLFGEEYTKLRELQKFYAANFTSTVDTNKLITIFELLIANLRDYIQQLIPAHSNLICGILIEPNILERRKLNFYKNFSTSGTNTRSTLKSIVSQSVAGIEHPIYSLEDKIDINGLLDVQADWFVHDAIVEDASIFVIDESAVSYPSFDFNIPTEVDPITNGDYSLLEDDIMESKFGLDAEFPSYSTFISESVFRDPIEFNPFPNDSINMQTYPTLEAESDLQLDFTSVQDGLIFKLPYDLSNNNAKYFSAISSITDFSDLGVVTYFNNPDGIYLFTRTASTSIPSDILRFLNTAWQRGTAYIQNDVVSQVNETGDAKDGNNRFYRFIASTTTPVESFVPPYLDGSLWEVVRFTKHYTSIPRRVVFDFQGQPLSAEVFPALNIIDPNKILATNNRSSAGFDGIMLSGNSSVTGVFNIQNIFALLGYQSTVSNIRMRLFQTGTDLSGLSSPLVDVTISSTNVVSLAELLILYNNNTPVTTVVYYRFDNLDALNKNFSMVFYYFGIDAKPLVPRGYLPRHYKFFRDNTTATKRRNYLGCIQTQFTTLDGESPVQIILSPSAELTIPPTSTQTDITVGGGGTLNVS